MGLFMANDETNKVNERNLIKIPTGERQTSWLSTSITDELD